VRGLREVLPRRGDPEPGVGLAPRGLRERIVVRVGRPHHPVHRGVAQGAAGQLLDVLTSPRVDGRAAAVVGGDDDDDDQRLAAGAGAGLDRLDQVRGLVDVQLVDHRAMDVRPVQQLGDLGHHREVAATRLVHDP
jgi:hypothetical protein